MTDSAASDWHAIGAHAALRKMASPRASVPRDGMRRTVAVAAWVPGDVVLLEAGDRVPGLRVSAE